MVKVEIRNGSYLWDWCQGTKAAEIFDRWDIDAIFDHLEMCGEDEDVTIDIGQLVTQFTAYTLAELVEDFSTGAGDGCLLRIDEPFDPSDSEHVEKVEAWFNERTLLLSVDRGSSDPCTYVLGQF